MGPWCRYPGCDEPAKYQVFTVKDIIRYCIDHCEQHRKWAVDYLERYTGGTDEHTGNDKGPVQ
jgi:hypothetical protein